MRVGETVSNTIKGGGADERGGETKTLKRGQAWLRGGRFKKGAGPPYELCNIYVLIFILKSKTFFYCAMTIYIPSILFKSNQV